MKAAIFALLAGSAAAFAPVAQKASSTALHMGFEKEVGAQAPLGLFVSPFLYRNFCALQRYRLNFCFYFIGPFGFAGGCRSREIRSFTLR